MCVVVINNGLFSVMDMFVCGGCCLWYMSSHHLPTPQFNCDFDTLCTTIAAISQGKSPLAIFSNGMLQPEVSVY